MKLPVFFFRKKTQRVDSLKSTSYPLNLTENNGNFWITIDGKEYTIKIDNPTGYKDAYELCPPVSAIVGKLAKPFSNGKWYVLDKDNNEVNTSAISDITAILARPNPLQTWSQFIAQHKVYKRVFGNGFIYAIRPEGMTKISSLWNLPNQNITFQEIGSPLYKAGIYEMLSRPVLLYNGVSYELDFDSLLIMRDETVSMKTMVLAESRLKGLNIPINNLLKALKARGVLAARKGIPLGMISPENKDGIGSPIPITQKEKDDIHTQMKATYQMTEDMAQIIIPQTAMKWDSMAFPTKDLMLLEEIIDDTRMICDGLDFPWELLSHDKGTTFDNQAQAWKRLYQDIVIPESNEDARAFTSFLGLDKYGYHLDVDYSHISVLQADEKSKAEAAKALNEALQIEFVNNLITLNEWRLARGYDELPAGGDLYYTQIQNNGSTA